MVLGVFDLLIASSICSVVMGKVENTLDKFELSYVWEDASFK